MKINLSNLQGQRRVLLARNNPTLLFHKYFIRQVPWKCMMIGFKLVTWPVGGNSMT